MQSEDRHLQALRDRRPARPDRVHIGHGGRHRYSRGGFKRADPPLRRRREGIPPLVAYFIEHHGRAFGRSIRFISREALAKLCACEWPGNVRQLSNAVESAMMMTDSDRIAISDLPDSVAQNERRIEGVEAPTEDIAAPSAHTAASDNAGDRKSVV